jgi:hypothetical protein
LIRQGYSRYLHCKIFVSKDILKCFDTVWLSTPLPKININTEPPETCEQVASLMAFHAASATFEGKKITIR